MLQNSKYKLRIASKFMEWKIVLYVLTSIIVSLAVLVLKGVALQKTDLLALLRQVIVLLESQAIMNNVQLITQFRVDCLAIECNENQIKQVFINIIKNAIEAMPSGVSIIIEATKHFKWMLIRIIDQGLGIPAENLSKLGEPFYSTKEEGTGFGLMVSFKIIRNHGGSIKVQSK